MGRVQILHKRAKEETSYESKHLNNDAYFTKNNISLELNLRNIIKHLFRTEYKKNTCQA